MSYDDYAYLAKIKKERMCQKFILEVKRNADHTNTYSGQSSAIYDIKFYEGILEDDSLIYFSIVRFKTKYGGPSKEYIYEGNEYTEKNYASNYRYSAGRAFYNYIYKYNTNDLCSSGQRLSESALYDPINEISRSSNTLYNNVRPNYSTPKTSFENKNGVISLNGWEYNGSYLFKSKTYSFAVIYSDSELKNKLYSVDNNDDILIIKKVNDSVYRIWYLGSFGYISNSMLKKSY